MTCSVSNPFHPDVQRLCTRVARAQEQWQQRGFAEARDELLEALGEAKALGLAAPDILWSLGCVADNLRDFPAALDYCRRALEFDPLSPSYRRSWNIVVGRVREAILDEARHLDAQQAIHLCTLLARHSAADDTIHLAHARALIESGDYAEAKAIMMALTKLSPNSVEPWAVLAHLAVLTDDADLVERVSAAAMHTGQPDPPLFASRPTARA